MRALDPAFKAHLNSGATTLATCWRIERRDGYILGFTDHDRRLAFDGTVFLPDSGATGSTLAASADLSVDNGEIAGALAADALRADDLAAGFYDGASITLFRVNWAHPEQRVLLRQGVMGEVRRDGDGFRAEMRGLSHHLGQATGRIYQPMCDVNLGSRPCGVDLNNVKFQTNGRVTALRDEQSFIADGFASFADDWFTHGLLRWTSGTNTNLSAHIKQQAANGAISIWLPAGAPINIGDQFTATAGCDKRHTTCQEKFSNIINFRGFPFMPGNDVVTAYPLRRENNDGGKRS